MPTQDHPRTNVPRGDKALIEEIWEMVHECIDLLNELKTHTHQGDGAQPGTYFTSEPRTDAATLTGGTATTAPVPEKMSH